MGGNNSKSCTSAMSLVSSTILNSAITQTTTCKSSTTAVQNNVVSISGTPYLTCVSNLATAKGWTASDIQALCSPLQTNNNTINGVSQTAQLNISTNCSLTATQTAQAAQDVTNAINQSLASSTDDAGQFLKSLGVALGGNSNDTASLSTAIASQVSTTMKVDTVNTFINDYAVNQSQIVSISGASSSQIQNVSQAIALKALADLVSTNTTLNTAAQTADNTVKSTATSSDQILPGLWASIQSLFKGIFGTVQTAYIAMAVCVIAVMCCCSSSAIAFFMNGGAGVLDHTVSVAGNIAQSQMGGKMKL